MGDGRIPLKINGESCLNKAMLANNVALFHFPNNPATPMPFIHDLKGIHHDWGAFSFLFIYFFRQSKSSDFRAYSTREPLLFAADGMESCFYQSRTVGVANVMVGESQWRFI